MSKIEECYNKECSYCIDNKCNFNINDITKCNWYQPRLTQLKNNTKEVEKGWMVRRDDGMFFAMEDYKGDAVFCDDFNIFNGIMNTKKECKNIIKFYKLQNCHPVKVEIRVVGE